MKTRWQRLTNYLEANPGTTQTPQELASALKVRRSTIRAYLTFLRKAGNLTETPVVGGVARSVKEAGNA